MNCRAKLISKAFFSRVATCTLADSLSSPVSLFLFLSLSLSLSLSVVLFFTLFWQENSLQIYEEVSVVRPSAF